MSMNVAAEAAALEAEVEQYPDERGEILLEAADTWRRAGAARSRSRPAEQTDR
ncbi:hypothetical protein AB0873_10040 [Micromonospora sp. NPDC047707]|uniref:hypothetical protein n=1 Tax=Micromonospora sp. NPDC047707 TaxID=3154498 RepID=UPI003452450B